MAKIFIDTNIYLDFYRTNRESLSVFRELYEKAKGKLIFPEQVYKEFRRNRSNKIIEIKNLMDKPQFNPPPFLGEQKDFIEKKKAYIQSIDQVKKLMDEMVEDPEKDPVFREVKAIYDHSIKIIRSEEIVTKAEMRKKLGDPPVSKGKNTIGDEVIWESILAEVKDDLVIVSRDGTYSSDFDVLRDEFQDSAQKNIIKVTSSISEGLKALGEEPSKEMIEVERKIESERNKQPITNVDTNILIELNKNRLDLGADYSSKFPFLFFFYKNYCHVCGAVDSMNDDACTICGAGRDD